jgi:hypothetical protein
MDMQASRPESWTEAHDRIADVVEENVALGRHWNEGLLLVSGVPVAVREEVIADASAFIYPKVDGYLRWKLGSKYGAGLWATDGENNGTELLDSAREGALDDLALNWLKKDRHLTLFLRDRFGTLDAAKAAAWKRAEQELHRELDRLGQGTAAVGDLRPLAAPWRAYTGQRSWSKRMARPADVVYFEQEDERLRQTRPPEDLRERLRGPEPERMVPRRAREPASACGTT